MEQHHWQVWLIGAIGLWLVVSPFVLDVPFVEGAEAGAFRWTFVGAGSVVVVLALSALSSFHAWEAGMAVIAGTWLLLSPWIVGFTTPPAALWSALLPGAAIVGLGLWAVATARQAPAG